MLSTTLKCLLMGFVLLVSGCFPQGTVPSFPVVDMHTSRIALDWPGIYAGILPCVDCAGIDTRLRLNADQTYVLETRHLGRTDEVFEDRGVFVRQPDGNRIRLLGLEGGAEFYQVGENQLFQLDRQGRRMSGNPDDTYALRKLDGFLPPAK